MNMIQPMLAERAPGPFDSDRHLFEVKYDGARCLAYFRDGSVRLLARSGNDHTSGFPELAGVGAQVNAADAVLDGELVVEGQPGRREAFRALSSRMHTSNPLKVRIAAQVIPATYVVFDVLRLNGTDLTTNGIRAPLEGRKELLAKLVRPDERLRAAEHVEGGGIALFEECIREGLEGVMAKERQGLYHPGLRHADWLKVKGVQEASYVVCGFTRGEGWRDGMLGSLLLGEPDGNGRMRSVGSVGTGFTVADLERVFSLVDGFRSLDCPFDEPPYEPKLWSYTEPRLVVDVKYHALTLDGKLRFPVFLRERHDISVEELRP